MAESGDKFKITDLVGVDFLRPPAGLGNETLMLGDGPFPLPSWWEDVLYNSHLDVHLNVSDASREFPSGAGSVRIDGVVVSVTDEGKGTMDAGEPLPVKDLVNVIVRGLIRGEGGMNPTGVKDPIDVGTLADVLKISYGPEGVIAPGLIELRTVNGVEVWVLAQKAFTSEAYGKDGGLFVSYEHIKVAKEAAKNKIAEAAASTAADGVVAEAPAVETPVGETAVVVVPSQPGLEVTRAPSSVEGGTALSAGCLVVGFIFASAFVMHVLGLNRRQN